MWAFVGSKDNPRWLWYAMDADTGRILAYQLGRRTDATLHKLLALLALLPVKILYSDDWGAYARHLPNAGYVHIVGKEHMQKIERRNLNFRQHLARLRRKTLCFSKCEDMHDIVIGLYINRYYYEYGSFAEAVAA